MNGHLTLAALAEGRLDLANAARHFAAARTLSTDDEAMGPLLGLLRTTAFDGDGKGLLLADEALALAEQQGGDAKVLRETLGAIRAQKARVLLNLRRDQEALVLLRVATTDFGGAETLVVTAADIAARSDLAMALLRQGRRDEARTALAYTGAGSDNGGLPHPYSYAVPQCGGTLKPADSAIIELSLDVSGNVIGARPVIVPGGREAAEEFTRSVRDWRWDDAGVAQMLPLQRLLSRVELRCTNAPMVAERSLLAPLWTGVSETPANDGRFAISSQGPDNPDPAGLTAVLRNFWPRDADRNAQAAAFASLLAEVRALGYPPRFLTYLRLRQADNINDGKTAAKWRKNQIAGLTQLLADPEVRGDAASRAVITLSLVRAQTDQTSSAANADLVDGLLADPAYPANAPLRQFAAIERANLAARAGDTIAAAGFFEQSGLSERQCALLAPKPVWRNTGPLIYPAEVQRMGISGWTRMEYDIDASGKPIAPRPIIAYPPFVFDQGGADIIKGSRFEPSYRPTGGAACSATSSTIRFNLID